MPRINNCQACGRDTPRRVYCQRCCPYGTDHRFASCPSTESKDRRAFTIDGDQQNILSSMPINEDDYSDDSPILKLGELDRQLG